VKPLNPNVPFASGSNESSTASTMGVTYNAGKWMWSARLDYRDADTGDRRGIATAVQTDPRSNLSLLAGLQAFDLTGAASGDSLSGSARLGLAYRPPRSRWLVLNKLEWAQDRKSGGAFEFRNSRLINNLNLNYLVDRWQVSVQYGAKFVTETIAGACYSGYTDLTGLETRYDIAPHWDVGLRGSILHGWSAGQYDYSYGASVGRDLMKNIWISLGYNVAGFEDRDFSDAGTTSRGPFVMFRMKFDQQSLKEALRWVARPAPGAEAPSRAPAQQGGGH
jgi:hypothetical protein